MDNIELPTYEELASQQAKLLDENMMQENHIKELEQENAELTKERDELNQEIDTLRMQLAACGVAALSNTQESLDKFKNELGDDYYCASVEDCINATQKQIDLHRDLKLCQAKGIDKAVDAFYDSRGCYTSEDEGVVTDFMRGYANQLREQAK